MAEVILEGSGLRKTYGGVTAVDDVEIRVHAGEVLGLVGPNGAGKTTLVDIISGAQSADAGALRLRGRELKGSAARRARAGMARTFQHPQLALELSARDNLVLGRAGLRMGSPLAMVREAVRGAWRPQDADDDRAVEEIAEELGLEDIDRLAGDLPLGEQRLIEVGRALGQDPTLLLLDEPFAGADANGVRGINEVIRIVQQRGHAVILVDHNIDLVADVVDRMVLLNRGSVAFDGDPKACMSSDEMRTVYFGAGLNVA